MDRTYPDGRKIHPTLVASPSHLECVNAVVVGTLKRSNITVEIGTRLWARARALNCSANYIQCQQRIHSTNALRSIHMPEDVRNVVPILLHCVAASPVKGSSMRL
jgi:2-oxoglutarate dehydrogenase complex dehydrogenase (E1) component-like enzyme